LLLCACFLTPQLNPSPTRDEGLFETLHALFRGAKSHTVNPFKSHVIDVLLLNPFLSAWLGCSLLRGEPIEGIAPRQPGARDAQGRGPDAAGHLPIETRESSLENPVRPGHGMRLHEPQVCHPAANALCRGWR
jgi:hypothetical protein